ncbi:hypothetical protein K493DRAFT_412037 [Basidiobolus meristosporus CBS 931.73]|uniref:Pectin lyase-like protein n=1 Tax=Basidiobolus meristosporus CBS 931.73 TaxID=1314790 RepID=A0A1Y1X5R3_9FUNG|nr:hypothetical protein K493DRAFT_412037 [Basidiobolus meristosporus CBS 931.73]|eukprot:ORX81151.1 hypothetical protein K493DRAFT_412037 [Basidiobolus meristosporus CBS 931.73]
MLYLLFLLIFNGLGAVVSGSPSGLGKTFSVYNNLETDQLEYRGDAEGNQIPDFSHAGYRGGGVPLPSVPVVKVLYPHPKNADDTLRIQAAINAVGSLPLGRDGIRGAILLKAGTYRVSGTLILGKEGVVLRGEGCGENPAHQTFSGNLTRDSKTTTIIATGTKLRPLIKIVGPHLPPYRKLSNSGKVRLVTDPPVPIGATEFHVEWSASYKHMEVGQTIIIHRPSPSNWIHDIGMDRMPTRGDGKRVRQWQSGRFDFVFERRIVAIDRSTRKITIDVPLLMSLDARYGGGDFVRINEPRRIGEIGVENLQLVSEYVQGQENSDENHATDAIRIEGGVENVWISDIVSKHFVHGCVNIRPNVRYVTVQDSADLDPVSLITGARRYSFQVDGQRSLFLRTYSRKSRHAFSTGSRVQGPNVFSYAVGVDQYADIGPHNHFGIGTLYDNVKTDGKISVENRGSAGSGQGWAGVTQVLWNCEARQLILTRPALSANNWAIGCIGRKIMSKNAGVDGVWESFGHKVEEIPSLYLKQLINRKGVKAAYALQPRIYTFP